MHNALAAVTVAGTVASIDTRDAAKALVTDMKKTNYEIEQNQRETMKVLEKMVTLMNCMKDSSGLD